MIFQGSGIRVGTRVQSPSSIMDLGSTLCSLAGGEEPPEQDGKSLISQLDTGVEDFERYVLSEFVETVLGKKKVPGRMVVKNNWKYITYAGYEDFDLLFDLEKDPYELENIANVYIDVAKEMKELAAKDWDAEKVLKNYEIRAKHLQIQKKWIKNIEPDQTERWITIPEALEYPEIFYKSSIELPEHIKNRMKL